jgi:3-hydroxybutyryl-CoA dehydrogenase
MAVEVVGVVGAGTIGAGLAQSLAQTGHQVILIDLAEEKLQNACKGIRNNLRLARMLAPAAGAESSAETLKRITVSTDYKALGDAQFVIENVTEKWDVKLPAWQKIDLCAPRDCVLAANTSAISITCIASATSRPSWVIGMHFMNPVPLKPAVEVIRGFHTSDETVAVAMEFLAGMRKEGIVVQDMPGFVSNRVLMPMVNEAVFLLQEGVASAEQIDNIFRSCFGHKMGPLETADLIGLDTVLYSIDVLYDSYKDSKYRPCPLLRKMVSAGIFGQKSGRGFYDYYNK